MNKYWVGALAGCLATAPMTAAMLLLHRQLPQRERYLLPPEDITAEIAARVGIQQHLTETEQDVVTWLSHFGFGAVAGAIYAPLAAKVAAPPAMKGACFGLLVWGVSYLGGLPITKILNQPKEQAARPNLLMIAAHLIWGVSLGVLTEHWQEE